MKHVIPHDLLPQQLVIGSVVYIADYIPVIKPRKKLTCRMMPRVLNDYWLQYVHQLGMYEVDPIFVNQSTLESLNDLTHEEIGWGIDGTDFFVSIDENEPYIAHRNGDIRLFQVKYVHQLQLAYSLLTGAILDVSRLVKELRPYNDSSRNN